VLHNQLAIYENLEVEWSAGATPTAYLYDADNTVIESFELGDRSLEQLFELFAEHGFTPKLPVVNYPETPDATGTYGGHQYDVYAITNFHSPANEFVRAQQRDGRAGYMVTITSPRENAFVADLLMRAGAEKGWLGVGDELDEGLWLWKGGAAAEQGGVIWRGGVDGSVEEGLFTNWREGEPNDVNDEDCGVMYSDGRWNDGTCSMEMASLVVEFGDAPLVEEAEPEIPGLEQAKPDL